MNQTRSLDLSLLLNYYTKLILDATLKAGFVHSWLKYFCTLCFFATYIRSVSDLLSIFRNSIDGCTTQMAFRGWFRSVN